jgi:hypothetical protein
VGVVGGDVVKAGVDEDADTHRDDDDQDDERYKGLAESIHGRSPLEQESYAGNDLPIENRLMVGTGIIGCNAVATDASSTGSANVSAVGASASRAPLAGELPTNSSTVGPDRVQFLRFIFRAARNVVALC